MNSYYYLVSQLPNIPVSSDSKSNLPLNGDSFRELCSRFVNEKEKKVINELSLVPPKDKECQTGSEFLDAWYEKERNLRIALASVRAQKLKKDAIPLPVSCTQDILQTARTATGTDSPLSAEQFLYDYRLKLLDEMRPSDNFSIDSVYAYGIRLLLAERMRKFDAENGRNSYHKIYDTILGESV